jgi:hypothetical protein
MKKIYLFIFIGLFSVKIQAQTSLIYSGTNVLNINSSPTKAGAIAQNFTTTGAGFNLHAGLVGNASNGGVNVGLYGTTVKNTAGNATKYIGVFGDNSFNSLSVGSTETYGGYFAAKNSGATSAIYGTKSEANGSNNTSLTLGIESIATNSSNTNPNAAIGIRGITISGQSTVATIYRDVANPGGYFSSNDGQGIYATTSGTYKSGTSTVSQAVTGYSNITNAFNNVGVVGFAEGTGAFKIGVYGAADGTAAGLLSSGITGEDKVNSTNSYAGYFIGRVWVDGGLRSTSLSGTGLRNVSADANGNLTVSSPTRYYSAPHVAFVRVANDASMISYLSGTAYLSLGTGTIRMPVYLPHGAKLTNARVHYNDNDAVNDLTFAVIQSSVSANSVSLLASGSSSGNVVSNLLIDLALSNPIVDNQNSSYYIEVNPKTGGSVWTNSSSLSVRSIVITYTE